MNPENWLSCPAGCTETVNVAIVGSGIVGFHCPSCGRKVEFPTQKVESDYKTTEG